MSVKVTLVSGRSLSQGTGKERGKFSNEYLQSVAICELDQSDLEALGIVPGKNVRVTTKFGSAVLKGTVSRTSQKGIAFVPCGIWASLLTDEKTQGSGMPCFKGIEAEITPAESERVLTVSEVVEAISKRKVKV